MSNGRRHINVDTYIGFVDVNVAQGNTGGYLHWAGSDGIGIHIYQS
jgi:hypothetical protein